jgi:hypothetical protein
MRECDRRVRHLEAPPTGGVGPDASANRLLVVVQGDGPGISAVNQGEAPSPRDRDSPRCSCAGPHADTVASHTLAGKEIAAMFGHHKLLTDGAKAEAVVIEVTRVGGITYDPDGSSNSQYDLLLRVHFPDSATADARCRVGGWFKGIKPTFSQGDVVPVRYDPADRAKVEVDLPAIEEKQQARTDAAKEMRIKLAEEALASDRDSDGS